ncbi:MAG TPA: hypothetical protein VHA76_16920 [Solirubrobacterales bacterium]|nr:hypothetical protein [Solirubrobacterales bacterium]
MGSLWSERETGNERDGVAKEIEFVLDLEIPDQGTVRVMYDRDDPRKALDEGHVRSQTDIVAHEIVSRGGRPSCARPSRWRPWPVEAATAKAGGVGRGARVRDERRADVRVSPGRSA